MLSELFTLGERLSGTRDVRLRRGLLFAFLEAMAVAAPYAFVLHFVRATLERRVSTDLIISVTAGIVGSLLLRLVLASAAMSNLFVGAHALLGKARIRAADHLRKLPMGFFMERRSGELASVLTSDIALVEDMWSHTIGVFASSFALPMLVGVGLCFLDWRLGLLVLAALPVALAVLALTSPLFVREIDAVLGAMAEVNGRVVEYVQGIAVLRAFGRHGEIYQRLVSAMERLCRALIRADVLPSPLLGVFGLVVEASFVVVALVGSALALRRTIEPSVLVVFLIVTVGVMRQVADLGVALLQLRGSQRALRRVDQLFAQPALAEPARAQKLARFDVEIEDVTFGYGEERVLDHVSATFAERSLTAIVGASGAGKTTLVHLVARLWDVPPGQGTIRIGGIDVRDVSFEELHRHVAMVFQDVVLFSGSILENIRIGRPEATREEVERAARAARAHDFIMALPDAYDSQLGEGGGKLSGGERQRISIARALLKNAPIVLLDEATASVDAVSDVEIQRAIDALVAQRTVVVIAHRLRTVLRAQQIVVLEAGRVAESGTHDALLKRDGVYAGLWREQERALGWRIAAEPTA